MNDLHNRFRTLDDVSAPNLWSDIEERAVAIQPTRRSNAWVLIAVTLLLALVIGGAVLVGSGIVKLPVTVDASASPSSANPSSSAQASTAASASPVAPVPASWTATGSMIEARVDFTATLLLDGRVLVTGGDRGFDAVPRALSSAELYDPATGTWTATGSMLQGRYRHTATLLPNGKVLVAAGNVSSSGQVGDACCLASAELYDPARGTWTATGTMMTARVAHTATLLLNGTVLVAGGDSAHVNGKEPGVELYDPTTGTWTPTGVIVDRLDHTATLLRDGRVFVTGGVQSPGELYDPRTGSWSATDCCTDAPNNLGPYMTATLLPDGKVLVAGGLFSGSGVDSHLVRTPAAALYDPASGRWTATGSMLVTREEFTATLLIDGRVLVAGGYLPGASPLATAELYDPSTGTWIATATMVEGRHRQMAILLLDGRVLVAGGSGPEVLDPATSQYSTPNLASAELYDPGSGT